eukprot:CAMPEP_0183376226 /NCGR_PEP_ID=MMETSP0164_2-20130417/119676_1 /TAXON_ID=221442 /ORGANISM="Coccolithus pelagicus ssp braarudi, Strain PLY182g" /LENGTH=30 /DNA_ID= /DNA_START= /DNA_END= /DNA_ORIENTATION=
MSSPSARAACTATPESARDSSSPEVAAEEV